MRWTGHAGMYGGEEECLQNFERKNYRSVFVVMLKLAVMHPVVHECIYTTRSVFLQATQYVQFPSDSAPYISPT